MEPSIRATPLVLLLLLVVTAEASPIHFTGSLGELARIFGEKVEEIIDDGTGNAVGMVVYKAGEEALGAMAKWLKGKRGYKALEVGTDPKTHRECVKYVLNKPVNRKCIIP